MQEIPEHPDSLPRRRFLAQVPVLLAAAIAAGSIGFAVEESPVPPAPVRIDANKQQPVGWVAASFRLDGVDLTLHAIGGNRKEDGKTTSIEWKR